MSTYNTLIGNIVDKIKANGNREITGPIMQDILIQIVDQLRAHPLYGGQASKLAPVPDDDKNLFFVTLDSGKHTYYDNLETEGPAILQRNSAGLWEALELGYLLAPEVRYKLAYDYGATAQHVTFVKDINIYKQEAGYGYYISKIITSTQTVWVSKTNGTPDPVNDPHVVVVADNNGLGHYEDSNMGLDIVLDWSAQNIIEDTLGVLVFFTPLSYSGIITEYARKTELFSKDFNDLLNKPVIDTSMSDSSDNAAKNKIIKAYIDAAAVALQNQIDAIAAGSDVVAVVATYADLLAFDTSTITDNDIIKVLADETKSGNRTYYKWDLVQWNYIGTESAGYTKAEADAKFVEKIPGKALSENDYTDAEKSKVTTSYNHSQQTGNAHNMVKGDIGLGNVNNTSDENKPISIATQNALNAKADKNGDSNEDFNSNESYANKFLASYAQLGQIFLSSSGVSTNTNILYINLEGVDGDRTAYKDTVIGNGKGLHLIEVDGASGQVDVDGVINAPRFETDNGTDEQLVTGTGNLVDKDSVSGLKKVDLDTTPQVDGVTISNSGGDNALIPVVSEAAAGVMSPSQLEKLNKADGLKLSAKNLLKQTDLLAWNSCEKIGFNEYKFSYQDVYNQFGSNTCLPNVSFKSNTQYVISFDFKAEVERDFGWKLRVFYTDGTYSELTLDNYTTYTHVEYVSTSNKSIDKVISTHGTSAGGDQIHIKNFSIIESNKPMIVGIADEDTDEKIKNLGVRNLLLNSGILVRNASYPLTQYSYTDAPKDGEVVRIVLKGKLGADSDAWRFYNSGGSVYLRTVSKLSNNTEIYQTSPFVWRVGTSSNTHINVYAGTSGETDESEIEWIKLVKGDITNKEWSPAFEDKANKNGDSSEDFDINVLEAQGGKVGSTRLTSNEINTYAVSIGVNYKNGDGTQDTFKGFNVYDGKGGLSFGVAGNTKKTTYYGDIEAPKIIKTGGTSEQILMANGSTIDKNSLSLAGVIYFNQQPPVGTIQNMDTFLVPEGFKGLKIFYRNSNDAGDISYNGSVEIQLGVQENVFIHDMMLLNKGIYFFRSITVSDVVDGYRTVTIHDAHRETQGWSTDPYTSTPNLHCVVLQARALLY